MGPTSPEYEKGGGDLPIYTGRFLHAATGSMEPWPFDCDPPTGEEDGWFLFSFRGEVKNGDLVKVINSKTVVLAGEHDNAFGYVRKVSKGFCWVDTAGRVYAR